MKNKLIIIALVLLIGGGAAFALTRNKDDSNGSTTQKNGAKTGSGFDAVSTSGASFVATITTTVEGKEVVATMEYDKNSGNVRYTSNTDGQNFVIVYTSDAYYMCQTADNCIKYPVGQGQSSGFDPKAYEYSDEELAGWKNTALDKGKKACASGTCYVWEVNTGGYASSVYIDTKTKRVIQVESATAAGASKIVYEYKDVSITPPANAQTLPTL